MQFSIRVPLHLTTKIRGVSCRLFIWTQEGAQILSYVSYQYLGAGRVPIITLKGCKRNTSSNNCFHILICAAMKLVERDCSSIKFNRGGQIRNSLQNSELGLSEILSEFQHIYAFDALAQVFDRVLAEFTGFQNASLIGILLVTHTNRDRRQIKVSLLQKAPKEAY